MFGKPKISKIVFNAFLAYTIIFFIVPFIFSLIWWDEFFTRYKMTDNLWIMLLIPIMILLVHVFDRAIPKFNLGISKYLSFILFNKFVLSVFAITFLVVSIYFYKNYSISFRHKNEIREAGGLIMILWALKMYFRAYLFIGLLKYANGQKFNGFEKRILLIMLVSFFLSMAASFDVLYMVVSALLLFDVKKVLGQMREKKDVMKSLLRQISIGFSLIVLVVGILFVGVANKIGTDTAGDLFSNAENIGYLFQHTILRMSTYYVSLLVSGSIFFDNIFFSMDAIYGTIQTMLIRINSLITGESIGERPEVWSINRLNYLNIFRDSYLERTGASPGIYAMLFYIPFFPFSIFIVTGYLIYILRLASSVLEKIRIEVNIFFLILILLNLLPLFENPLSFINIIDIPFLYFLFVVAAIAKLKSSILNSNDYVVKN